jgi:phosphatidylserine/phosphatidylglycerophosphate/cardiolipin synthase-like enzyme
MKRLLLVIMVFMTEPTTCMLVSNLGKTHFVKNGQKKYPYQSKKQYSQVEKPIIVSIPCIIDKSLSVQTIFTTVQNLSPTLLQIIAETQKRLDIAAFSLTDKRIAKEVINAHKRGVAVRVITDATNKQHGSSKIESLIQEGVPVWYYQPALKPEYKKGYSEPLMHHKFIIADDELITGSANLTKAAQQSNIENIIIIRIKQIIDEYCAEVARLLKLCKQYALQTTS